MEKKIKTALVEPVETKITEIDAPYELPEGWKWKSMPDVVIWGSGGTPKATEPKYYNNGTIPWLIIADLNDSIVNTSLSKITKEGLENSSAKLIPPNTLLVAMYGSIGKLGITGIECCTNQAIAFAKELKNVTTKYMYYYMASIKHQLIAMGRGGTQQNISQTLLNTLLVPLPPTLSEQQRIVARIESLFAKLDDAKEKAQNVVDSFENRKAAILHKAFTGELTKKWRKENGVGDDSWKTTRFDEIADIKSNLVDVKDYQDFPHIAPDNIEKYTGILLEYNTIAEDKVKSGKHRFYAGQILYSKIRPYLSKVVVVDFDGLCSADMYPIEARGNTRFLWYQMLSNEFLDQASNSGSRSVLPKINQKELSIIKMKDCMLEEQNEVVRILDTILEKESKAKEAAEAVLEQIDLLKKSILARAFRGEL